MRQKPEESASNVTNVSPSHLVQARLLAGAGSVSMCDVLTEYEGISMICNKRKHRALCMADHWPVP